MGKSSSLEDYLKSILILHNRNGSVRSIDIAEEMGVTKPSVSNAMKKLREREMIYFGEDGCVLFTDAGRKAAESIYSKHSLLSGFLMEVGVNRDTAEREACLMEHAISDETYECLDKYINKHNKNAITAKADKKS